MLSSSLSSGNKMSCSERVVLYCRFLNVTASFRQALQTNYYPIILFLCHYYLDMMFLWSIESIQIGLWTKWMFSHVFKALV